MSVAGTSSDLISLNSAEIESAWHTLSLRTSPGRPAQLPELELRSRLPHSLQEYISRIPGSPFTMTSGGFMNTSFVPCEGFAEFLTSPTASNVPRDAFSCRGIRGSRNSSVTYARKRKAQAPGNGTELLTSLKKRSMLIHKGGEVEPVKSIAVPKLLSSSNEIPSKETFDHSPSVKEQHLVNMGNLDESQRFYDFSAPLPDLNYFDLENMGCMRDVDTTASSPCVTNSVVPLRTDLHFPYDHAFLDIGLSAFQWSEAIEHDSKPVGMPNQPSLVNQTLDENSNTLSLELELFSGTPEVHTLERLKVIEKDFEASLMDLVDDNSQSDFQLASKKPPVTESIHWRKLHSKDDKLNTAQLESNETIFASRPTHCQWKETPTFNFAFADDAHNSVAIGLAMMSEANDLYEEKQGRSSKSSIPDNGIQNVPGPNFESIINAFTEEQYENVESSSEQKFLPYLLSIIMAEEEEEGSGLNQGGDGTVYKAQRKEDENFLVVKHETEQTKSEGLPKLSLSNEVTTMNPPERKLMPKFESFILQKMEGAGKEEHMNGTELSNISALSNRICRKANFDAPNSMDKEKDSVGMGSLDYSTVGLDHAYNLPMPLHDFTYSEFRNINYIREDKRESTTYVTNSLVTHNKTVDFLYEDVSLDIGLNASMPKEHDALRRLTTVELDCRPLLDGFLDRPSATNLALGEDCNAHSIELGLHVHERLSMIEKDLEQSLMEPLQDKSEACHAENNSQNVYPSPCQNQLVIEAIDEIEVRSKDDKLITSQLESKEIPVASKLSQCHRYESSIMTIAFGDNIENSTATGEKQRTSNNPSVNDLFDSDGQQNLAGQNLTSNITSSMNDPDRNVEIGLIHLQKVKDICAINSTSPSKDQDREVVVGSIHLHKLNETCDENLPSKENGVVVVTKPSKLSVFAMDEIADVSEEKKRAFKNPSINDQIADVSEEIQRALKNPSINDQIAVVSEDKQRDFNNPSINDQIASVGQQTLVGSNFASNSTSSTKDLGRDIEVGLVYLQKQKDVCNANMASKEYRVNAVTKNFSEQKLMPDFESFIILEEEGSGGYGTVYKAQRKDDRKIFAVKCPHASAHSHHVNNELKMLERFGGRNFVIKYEGSFKNGESECFVLEHVEHDRPEVLKKEIGLFELQWYGFCMFRALASLHKQGVVHRDVKPGNFLFSRNVNKGYLIDFNLASDLHQKFCKNSKRKMPSASAYLNSLPESKSYSSLHSRKLSNRGLLENSKKEAPNESKKVPISKCSKKKTHKDHEDGLPIVDRSKHGSQTADVSGLTSTKDQTSNKTPVDWLNQPMPCKGRKELINFVHKAMHSTQNLKPVSNFPSSQRKRVAAPMSPNDTRPLMLTPMPLHSGGNVVSGAGLKSKVSGKVKREGPCVGTKGFRAPEVLFKSFHQGCKIDMWSAGVTMLYLIIGRAPFGGDPEQNIKEIAKLRGSEELWEVAKLHNCETSFPVDLLDVSSLKSMKLRDWCAKHTRRPEFFELIPESLFDLVDRCLTVNPRCRFSAEEALMHKFFAPCHESIRKQRMLRKVVASDPSTSNL